MSTRIPRRIVAPHPRTMDEVVGRSLPQWAVDFVKIDLERDIQKGIHLTVKLAKFSGIPVVRSMYDEAVRFFKRVDRLMTKGDPFSMALARRMLDFPEPYEIRLGFTALGSFGSGLGDGALSDYVFAVLKNRPALRRTLTVEPDALCFIPWVDMDRTSDIVATIVKRHLVRFTQEQAAFWKFDPRCMKTRVVENCWDPSAEKLTSETASVPVDDLGRTFLLVPKGICRSGPAMNAGQYFRDLGPSGGRARQQASGTLKEQLLDDAAAHPDRLLKFAVDRMKDPTRFQPRREFRVPKPKR